MYVYVYMCVCIWVCVSMPVRRKETHQKAVAQRMAKAKKTKAAPLRPMEFMGRLAALVPKPRVNLTGTPSRVFMGLLTQQEAARICCSS